MALIDLRVLFSVFAVAVGVAPNIVIPPPVRPASLPDGGAALQTLELSPVPSAGATAPLAARVRAQPLMMPTRNVMGKTEVMESLTDSQASKSVVRSPAEQKRYGAHVTETFDFPEAQPVHAAVAGSVASWINFIAVMLLIAVPAAAGGHWWSQRRRASTAMESVASMELGVLKEGFAKPEARCALAAFTGESFNPLGMASKDNRAAQIENGRVIMMSHFAKHVPKLPGFDERTIKVLAALAAVAMPLAAQADDAVPPGGAPPAPAQEMVQGQQQLARVSGRVTYSRLLEFVDQGSVQRVDLYDLGRTAVATVKVGERVQQLVCDLPGATSGFLDKLSAKNVVIDVHTPDKPNQLTAILGDIAFPLLVIVGLLLLRRNQPGGGMPGMPGMQGKAKIQVVPETGVKFEDVAGIDEAKAELTEIVDFLKSPERFVKVGAKIPKGVLLTGPPGTGKTLMAKALAGESGVPFIQSSASEFIELFVGVGASRVRDIFKQAKEKAPCIVFIDEIDAIGRQRGAGMGGGNDEREQTLNQILTEMDGFEGNTGVIVVAATNRSDILDNALLRPGRFDRRVEVGLPDIKGREQILKVHVRNKKMEDNCTLVDIAKRTSGFSGADLENLMNESAILTARRNKKAITMEEINDAADRVIAGLAGKALADNAGKRLVAYHEAGNALVGTLLPHHDPVTKVTLIPRGQSKGLTWFTPGEDQSLISTAAMKARIAAALGGRAAEEVVFGNSQVTSAAGGKLQQVERIARSMVTQFGMSGVGTLAIDEGGFTGPSYSDELGSKIDDAIRSLSDEGYATAIECVTKNRDCLDRIVDELIEVESMTGDRFREIVEQYTTIPEKEMAV